MRFAVAALLAALILSFAIPASADAQDEPTPVVGGGSFNAAPILGPGSYSDTLLPTEYLYYGFRLAPGQRLHVTANSSLDIDTFLSLGLTDITANLHSPTRERVESSADYDDRGSFRVDGEEGLDITGPEPSAEEDTATSGPWPGPGVYYLAFYAIYVGPTEPPPRAEVPFHFEVEILGDAEPTPTPSATPTATPTPTPEADEEGPQPALAAAFGVGGLLVGVICGIFLRRRRR